ncbi:MAG: TnpV protein [Actinomycetia bacterium]|nr:TnpV protein [Actinomycetes bacterium]
MNESEYRENQPRKELEGQLLPEHFHDERTGLDYTLVDGTYYLPDLLPEDEEYSPGVWARKYLLYLKDFRPTLLSAMRTCNWNTRLHEIDRRAEEMYESLVSQMAEREGLTEGLKLKDPTAWAGLANSIRNRAEEIVKAEVIYN